MLITKNLLLLCELIAGLGVLLSSQSTAQTFANLHTFTGIPDGAQPRAVLVLSGNSLYGTTLIGGSENAGTVFKVNTDGTGYTNLHSFTGGDGNGPFAGLVVSANTLYGTASGGGASGGGTLFKLNTDGTGFTNLYSFTGGNDGYDPRGVLVLSGSTLYGTLEGGGSADKGSVFKVMTDGTGFTNLTGFDGGSDGNAPYAGLVLSGNTLYGTTYFGGASGNGTVFKLNTDGTGFTNLHAFTGGSDGGAPWAVLSLSGSTLYGTTSRGGGLDAGTVFKLSTDGTGFTNLYSFTGGSDGADPRAGLVLSGTTLYGEAEEGGNSDNGTVFQVNTDGTGFANLFSFSALNDSTNRDGALPSTGLILSDQSLYGTALGGGSADVGTIFSLSLPPPQLTIISSGNNAVLAWPTNAPGFTLQSNTNLVSPLTWSNVSPGAVVVNGQYTVTNPMSGKEKFYRLRQ